MRRARHGVHGQGSFVSPCRAKQPPEDHPRTPANVEFQMAKILVIDDSKLITHIAKAILTKRGHQVLVAHDGQKGFSMAKAQCPDLILLDLLMPLMDGYEACKRLKADPVTRDIPVIMVTSKAESADKVRGLETGAVDYVTKPFDAAELIARVNIHLRIKELYEALQEKNRQLRELANRDGLTGLYNHRYFQDQLAKDFSRALRYHESLSVVIFDIDHFKRLNDTYGHQAGDAVLKEVGSLVSSLTRDSDLAARYGGEEFVLILNHAPPEVAVEVAERLRRTVENHAFLIDDKTVLKITISAGCASFPHGRFSEPKELIESADKALYAAKQAGRNRVFSFNNV